MDKEYKHPEYQYLNLLKDVMENGRDEKEFNTGIVFKGVFPAHASFPAFFQLV